MATLTTRSISCPQGPTAKAVRTFLFLQGPHGPFFSLLGRTLCTAGAQVFRVGFNSGDQAFWREKAGYIPFRASLIEWPDYLAKLIERHGVTDIVLYGDTREIHAQAIKIARARNMTIHVFEEGYLRPYWVTYERNGSNGHSRLMDISIAEMRAAVADPQAAPSRPPAHWGDMRKHMFYGALYHGMVMLGKSSYPRYQPHRNIPVGREFKLHFKRLLLQPTHALERRIATARLRFGTFPYHLALLQLEHDSNFQSHSPFTKTTCFLSEVIDGFAEGAPGHHHLVFKAHPLEDDRSPLRQNIRKLARNAGIERRVHFIRGGKLARLLDDAQSAVTVNSTAGLQALWRGLPLHARGESVYGKPELVSNQPLSSFFADPTRPDTAACQDLRKFLLSTSQVPGGYYSTSGRRQLLRLIVDMMIAAEDPYDQLIAKKAAQEQQLRLVHGTAGTAIWN